jgi:hypothetical protein
MVLFYRIFTRLILPWFETNRSSDISQDEFKNHYLNKYNSVGYHWMILIILSFLNDNATEDDPFLYVGNLLITTILVGSLFVYYRSYKKTEIQIETIDHEELQERYQQFTKFPLYLYMFSFGIYTSIVFNIWMASLAMFFGYISYLIYAYTYRG